MVERERWSRKKKAKGLVDLVDFDVCRRVLGLERREIITCFSPCVFFFFFSTITGCTRKRIIIKFCCKLNVSF